MKNDIGENYHSPNHKLIKTNKFSYIIISFNQGIASLGDLAIQYYFKDELNIQPYEMSRIFAFTMLPWIIKPLLGLLTDLVPLFGYRRKVYLLICGFISFIAWILLAVYSTNIYSVIFLLFLISFSSSFSSVIGEAIVVELSNINDTKDSESAKHYVSLFFLFKNIGALISAFFRGYLIEIMTLRNIFLLCSTIPLLVIIAGLIIMEPTKVKIKHKHSTNSFDEIINNKYLDYYSLDPTFDEKKEKLLCTKIIKENKLLYEENNKKLIDEFIKFVKKKEAYIPALYTVLLFSIPNFSDAFFYYMTNFLYFSPSQLGILSFLTTLGVVIAISIYRVYLKTLSFKKLVNGSSFLYLVFTFLAFALVLRLNIMIGISDFTICSIGFFFISIFGELSMMPILTLACSICPNNLEATVYSFFMSSINLGFTISTLLSSFLTSWFAITANNFDSLGDLIIVSDLLKLIPIFVLLYINSKYFETFPNESEELKETQELQELTHSQNITRIII